MSPTDIDIIYDTQKIGAGWNLYKANGLTTTATSVTTSSNFYRTTAPFQFSFPQTTIDFGAFLAAEPEANAIANTVSLATILAIALITHF